MTKTIIGSKYEQTRDKLREKIRLGTANALEIKAENHSCYFCGQRAYDKIWVLTIKENLDGQEAESKYYLDDTCLRKAGLLAYFKSNRTI